MFNLVCHNERRERTEDVRDEVIEEHMLYNRGYVTRGLTKLRMRSFGISTPPEVLLG